MKKWLMSLNESNIGIHVVLQDYEIIKSGPEAFQ